MGIGEVQKMTPEKMSNISDRIAKIRIQDDEGEIIKFWSTHFPNWQKEKYSWFYKSNPAGTALGWLAKNRVGENLLGLAVVFPRTMWVDNEKLRAGVVGDFAFAKKARIFWPAFRLQKCVLSSVKEGHLDFIYGLPNENADRLMVRTGYIRIGQCVRFVKKIRSYGYLRDRLQNNFVARILSYLVDTAIFLIAPETWKSLMNRKSIFKTDTSFDAGFDRLWEKASGQYSLIGERNSTFLNWRFRQCPYIKFKVFTCTDKKTQEMYGYIVYRISDGELCITDMLVLDIDKYFDRLMVAFLNHGRRLNVDSVVFHFCGSGKIKTKIMKYRFSVRKEYHNFVVYANKDTLEKYDLTDLEKWYLMEADNDI